VPIALAEEESTPLWKLVLEQFQDQLVLILLGSAAVSFALALFEGGDDWTAFVDPAVVRYTPDHNNYTEQYLTESGH
jgi:Ca2+ transporting ATPase